MIKTTQIPKLSIGLWLLLFIYFLVVDPVWRSIGFESIMGWDVFGYYLYLPSIFIYDSLHELNFIDSIIAEYNLSSYFYQAHKAPNGNYVMAYPIGMAIVFFPFFLIGHAVALISNYPADGFSLPYKVTLYIGGAIYTITGLLLMIKILKRYFSDLIIFLLLFLLVFGTNYFHYTLLENLMPHNYLFTIYAAILYFTIKWHEKPKLSNAIVIGALLGLAIIIRPSEIVAIFIPLLYGIYNKTSFHFKFQLVRSNLIHLILLIIVTGLVGMIQVAYWKITTGDLLYYSYQGLGFDFLHPHIIKGLFSYKKGWLLYTPLMIFALVGFIWLYRRAPKLFIPILIFTILNIYFIYSWSVWWYGGSFGARAMVQSYALLLLPLGSTVIFVYHRKILWYLFLIACGFLIWLNIFQDWQLSKKMYSTEGMNQYVYWLIFGKSDIEKKDIIELTHNEFLEDDSIQNKELILKDSFDSAENDTVVHFSAPGSKKLGFNESITYEIEPALSAGDWIEASIMAYFNEYEWEPNNMAVADIIFIGTNGKPIKKASVRLQNIIGNNDINGPNDLFGTPHVWDEVKFATEAPQLEDYKQIELTIINKGYNPVYIDDLKVRHYRIAQ